MSDDAPAQSATSTESWPWLPVELVGSIISKAWHSPMTADERTKFFAAMCLVNRTWLDSFIRIALKDVHISSSRFPDYYLRLLRERTPQEPDNDYLLDGASSTANTLCQSLTFHIADSLRQPRLTPSSRPPITIHSCEDKSAEAVSTTLYMLSVLHLVPHLRDVTLEYANWGFDDIFEQGRLLVVPPQVARLALRFTFPGNERAVLVRCLRAEYKRRWHSGWLLPGVRVLAVAGAPVEFVSDMVEACPCLEALDVDGPVRLPALAGLPPSAHTLVLRVSDAPLGQNELDTWRLREALEQGLLARATSPAQIVVYSGAPERSAWDAAHKLCAGFGVRLVHCPWQPE